MVGMESLKLYIYSEGKQQIKKRAPNPQLIRLIITHRSTIAQRWIPDQVEDSKRHIEKNHNNALQSRLIN